MSTTDGQSGKRSMLDWLGNHPKFTLAGFLVGVVSLVSSVLFWVDGWKNRQLVAFSDEVRSIVVRAGQTERLQISLEGKPVCKDVTSIQVSLGNMGNLAIEPNDVLGEGYLTLRTVDATIIDAFVLSQSRPNIVKMRLDKSGMAEGEVKVLWDILEEDDGGVIQVIYQGGQDVAVRLEGTIKGQGSVTQDIVPYRPTGKAWKTPLRFLCLMAWWVGGVVVVCYFIGRFPEKVIPFVLTFTVLMVILWLGVVIVAEVINQWFGTHPPPFAVG